MKEFELPVLEAHTLIREAFGPMVEFGTSGLVSWAPSEVRLIRFNSLEQALASGLDTLSDVQPWDPASVMLGVQTAAVVDRLRHMGLDYGVFGRTGTVARVVLVHEPQADYYLLTPPGDNAGILGIRMTTAHRRNPRNRAAASSAVSLFRDISERFERC